MLTKEGITKKFRNYTELCIIDVLSDNLETQDWIRFEKEYLCEETQSL